MKKETTSRESNVKQNSAYVENSETEEDTIQYDQFIFPDDSIFVAEVLTVGEFHSDEVSGDAGKKKWMGLFHRNNQYYVSDTKLKIKQVHDPVLDDNENTKSGWNVQSTIPDSSILFLEGNEFLIPRRVESFNLNVENIFPGDTVKFMYLGNEYTIYAFGGKKKMQDNPIWYSVWNYKLYISSKIDGKEYKSLLVSQSYFDDKMIEFIFLGDLDGDSILDLILDTSNHYNVLEPTVYLSMPSEKSELVKPIGRHKSVGC